jgi:quercetin dioxygenase-like cupin family protein
MYVTHAPTADSSAVYGPGAEGVTIQWLIDETRGAPTFAMRRFVLQAGGHTPCHRHDWEHEVYILGGQGVLVSSGSETALAAGNAILVAPNEDHQFRAAPDCELEFLCMVPNGPATVH